MDLGTGLVVATALGIAAWQVDKRHAWRKARNLTLGLLSLLVLGGLGTWGYVSYENYRQSQVTARTAEQVRSGKFLSLAGVTLGDDRSRVVYALGQPIRDEDRILSWKESGAEKAVGFTEQGKAYVVLCSKSDSPYSYGCGDVAGLSIGDSEEQVNAVLGPPSRPAEFDGAEKTLFFGKKTGIDIVLKGGEITRFVLFEDRKHVRVVPHEPTKLSNLAPSKFGGVPVTDPELLEQLNSDSEAEPPPSFEREQSTNGNPTATEMP